MNIKNKIQLTSPEVCSFFSSYSFHGASLIFGLLFVFSCSKNGDTVEYTLNVNKPTNGSITSDAGGIDCGSKTDACQAQFNKGTEVTLTAVADTGYAPGDWSGGGCSGSDKTCVLTMDATKTVSKEFLEEPTLSAWKQFVNAKQNQTEPILPDFSYAGYHYFSKPVPDIQGRIFDVTKYGAIANDDLSDQGAIQSAIDSAKKNGGGIVFFPPGEFLVNTNADKNKTINIYSSNIILRGSGSRAGGTVIRQVNHMPPENPKNTNSSPYMFNFLPKNIRERILTRVTEDAARETFYLTVANASSLRVGQQIILHMKSLPAIKDFLAPYIAEASWAILKKGIQIRERHSIAEIVGNRIRLHEPLHTHINRKYGWEVRDYMYLEEVGVEDISFHGSWLDKFGHHKDAVHDGGWSLLRLKGCVNAWVRRVSFINYNRALRIVDCAAVSVYQITHAGNSGHFSALSQGNYGLWVGLSEDLASNFHGLMVGGHTTGTVYWRCDMNRGQPIDSHGSQPYANLLDRVNGGSISDRGSGKAGYPHHLRHFVAWNFKQQGALPLYDFWAWDWKWREGRSVYVMPIVVGLHGDPITFVKNRLEVLESNGQSVQPESLFEAQLKLRLQTIPVWLNDLRTEWKALRNHQLPNFLSTSSK